MVLRAAAGHMKEKEWEAWVVRNVGKSRQYPAVSNHLGSP